MVEAARISRGNVKPFSECKAEDFDVKKDKKKKLNKIGSSISRRKWNYQEFGKTRTQTRRYHC
jgi:hypothetical protein